MEYITQMIIQYVAEVVGLVIILALGIFSTWILNKINKNKNLQNISFAVEQVIAAAQETVRRLQQTVVEDLKAASADGKLTPEEIQNLKDQTILITFDQLSQPTIELLEAAKLDVCAIITNAAEAYINRLKQ